MANSFGIPPDVENRLRQRFTVCAYCRRTMKEYVGVKGCPADKATIEHLNFEGPVQWLDGVKEEDLVICCGSCNSSRGVKTHTVWFGSSYCEQKGISENTVAEEVKRYLVRKGQTQAVSVEPNQPRLFPASDSKIAEPVAPADRPRE